MSFDEKKEAANAPSGVHAETMPATSLPAAMPASLLHYRVLEKIGEGGMGAVFKAEDQRLARIVAIKRVVLDRLGRHAERLAAAREGIRRAERHLELDPTHIRALTLGAAALVKLGELDRAREWLQRAVDMAADRSDVSLTYNAACVFALIGDKDAALAQLERNIALGLGKRDWVEHDADLDSLRDDPRFKALLAKLP